MKKDGIETWFIMEIQHEAYKTWWAFLFFHLFSWIPVSTMSAECKATWKTLQAQGYYLRVRWAVFCKPAPELTPYLEAYRYI